MKTVMKKMFCLLLVAVLLISAVPAAFATETCPEGEHTWDDGVVEVDATCENNGRKTFNCTTCGATTSQYPDPLGHKYVEDTASAVAATCHSVGSKKYICQNDASHQYTEEIPATGQHVWSNATCTAPAKCTVAGCDAVNGTELGHNWIHDTAGSIAATCSAAGTKKYYCGVSGCTETKSEPIATLGHNIGSEGKCLNAGCSYVEANRCSVEFYLNYDNNNTPTTKFVAKGTNIYSLYTPYRYGYTFEGWYTASGNRVSESATVTGDNAYFAKWTQVAPHEVYVKFYTHGNTKNAVKIVDLYDYAQDGVITLADLKTVAYKTFTSRNKESLTVIGPFTSSEWDIFSSNSSYRNASEKINVKQDATTVIHAMVRNVDDAKTNSSTSSSSSKADSSNPKTGDMIYTPVIVMGASVSCLAVLFYLNKKRAF